MQLDVTHKVGTGYNRIMRLAILLVVGLCAFGMVQLEFFRGLDPIGVSSDRRFLSAFQFRVA